MSTWFVNLEQAKRRPRDRSTKNKKEKNLTKKTRRKKRKRSEKGGGRAPPIAEGPKKKRSVPKIEKKFLRKKWVKRVLTAKSLPNTWCHHQENPRGGKEIV